MKGVRMGSVLRSFNREAWRTKRDARQQLLDKVRARRRMVLLRERAKDK